MKQCEIVIFTQSPISKTPRVVKEANCLVSQGYNVKIFALWYEDQIIENEIRLLDSRIIYKAGVDITTLKIQNIYIRIKRRMYRQLTKILGIQSKHALGYGYNQFLKKLKAEKADLYIGHEEMSLALAKDLIKEGFKVAFDFEDFHSEDLLPRDRQFRPIKLLKYFEAYILKNAIFTTTTSDSLANAMASMYKTAIPITIYNSFHRKEIIPDKTNKQKKSLVWISEVVGLGRGIELLIDGIRQSKNSFTLTLIGRPDDKYCRNLRKNLPSNLSLVVSGYIASENIQSILAKHDIGIAFEELEPQNKYLTTSNKLFHYLNSGIAVLATSTLGQIEISLKSENAIKIVNHNSQEIAAALDQIFDNQQVLEKMKKSSKYFGQTKLCFENEEYKIIELVKNALVCS